MSKHEFHGFDPGLLREELRKIRVAAAKHHRAEKNLVRHLYLADVNRLYVWLGYKSLTGYCVHALQISRTQTQRLVTRVRRHKREVKQLTRYDERNSRIFPFFEETQSDTLASKKTDC